MLPTSASPGRQRAVSSCATPLQRRVVAVAAAKHGSHELSGSDKRDNQMAIASLSTSLIGGAGLAALGLGVEDSLPLFAQTPSNVLGWSYFLAWSISFYVSGGLGMHAASLLHAACAEQPSATGCCLFAPSACQGSCIWACCCVLHVFRAVSCSFGSCV